MVWWTGPWVTYGDGGAGRRGGRQAGYPPQETVKRNCFLLLYYRSWCQSQQCWLKSILFQEFWKSSVQVWGRTAYYMKCKIDSAETENYECLLEISLVALTPGEKFPNTLKGISGNLEAHDAHDTHVWTWLCSLWAAGPATGFGWWYRFSSPLQTNHCEGPSGPGMALSVGCWLPLWFVIRMSDKTWNPSQ